MNRDYVLFHLREAQCEIERTITEIESGPSYDYGEFVVAITHLYHHINTAWKRPRFNQESGRGLQRSRLRPVASVPR